MSIWILTIAIVAMFFSYVFTNRHFLASDIITVVLLLIAIIATITII